MIDAKEIRWAMTEIVQQGLSYHGIVCIDLLRNTFMPHRRPHHWQGWPLPIYANDNVNAIGNDYC